MKLPPQELEYIKAFCKKNGFPRLIDYHNSEWWAKRRREYYAKHEYRCRHCSGMRSLRLHHKTYKHIGYERDDELMPLCCYCNKREHERIERSIKKPSGKRAGWKRILFG